MVKNHFSLDILNIYFITPNCCYSAGHMETYSFVLACHNLYRTRDHLQQSSVDGRRLTPTLCCNLWLPARDSMPG